METAGFEIDAGTLVGDLRDGILRELAVAHTKPWGDRPEAEQRAVAERVHDLARSVVRQAVMLIADRGFPSLPGTLEAVAVKGGFKAVVKVPKGTDGWESLIRAEGKDVVVVIADPHEFFRTRGAVTIRPDQPALPYADEAAAVADAAESGEWEPNNEGIAPEAPQQMRASDPIPEGEATHTLAPAATMRRSRSRKAAAESAAGPDEGVVLEPQGTFLLALRDYAAFHVVPVADGQAIWHSWRDAQGVARGHEDADMAQQIAARQRQAAEDAEDEAWRSAEDRMPGAGA